MLGPSSLEFTRVTPKPFAPHPSKPFWLDVHSKIQVMEIRLLGQGGRALANQEKYENDLAVELMLQLRNLN